MKYETYSVTRGPSIAKATPVFQALTTLSNNKKMKTEDTLQLLKQHDWIQTLPLETYYSGKSKLARIDELKDTNQTLKSQRSDQDQAINALEERIIQINQQLQYLEATPWYCMLACRPKKQEYNDRKATELNEEVSELKKNRTDQLTQSLSLLEEIKQNQSEFQSLLSEIEQIKGYHPATDQACAKLTAQGKSILQKMNTRKALLESDISLDAVISELEQPIPFEKLLTPMQRFDEYLPTFRKERNYYSSADLNKTVARLVLGGNHAIRRFNQHIQEFRNNHSYYSSSDLNSVVTTLALGGEKGFEEFDKLLPTFKRKHSYYSSAELNNVVARLAVTEQSTVELFDRLLPEFKKKYSYYSSADLNNVVATLAIGGEQAIQNFDNMLAKFREKYSYHSTADLNSVVARLAVAGEDALEKFDRLRPEFRSKYSYYSSSDLNNVVASLAINGHKAVQKFDELLPVFRSKHSYYSSSDLNAVVAILATGEIKYDALTTHLQSRMELSGTAMSANDPHHSADIGALDMNQLLMMHFFYSDFLNEDQDHAENLTNHEFDIGSQVSAGLDNSPMDPNDTNFDTTDDIDGFDSGNDGFDFDAGGYDTGFDTTDF